VDVGPFGKGTDDRRRNKGILGKRAEQRGSEFGRAVLSLHYFFEKQVGKLLGCREFARGLTLLGGVEHAKMCLIKLMCGVSWVGAGGPRAFSPAVLLGTHADVDAQP
jgi:hypothetical protein